MSGKVAAHVREFPDVPQPSVRETRHVGEILPLLEAHRAYAAAMFAFLEARYFPRSRWYLAEGEGDRALVLEVSGHAGASLFTRGDPRGVAAIWDAVDSPRYSYLSIEAGHEEVARRHFLLRGFQSLVRMAVDGSTFRETGPSDARVLGPADAAEANRLYRKDSGVRISRHQLEQELYYGVWEDSCLVSIAGTQLISQEHGVAVIANVLTDPAYRNRGYATQCVNALTAALLERVREVVLSVDPENTPAVRAYRRLGYREVCRLAEAWAVWKGRHVWDRALAGLFSWLSR